MAGLYYAVWVATVTLLVPLGLPVVALVSIARPRWRAGLGDRLTLRRPAASGGAWIHAASAGEMRVALRIAERLRGHGIDALLTTNTRAGHDVAKGAGREARYAPVDHPIFVGRFLDAARPSALVVVETEIWPAMLRSARARRIPRVLANGRLSERALGRYRLVAPLLRETLASFDALLARSADDAARLRRLGAPGDRLRVSGDLKAPAPIARDGDEARRLREQLGVPRDALVVVAGSTDEGEEDIFLRALGQARAAHDTVVGLVAPRQPDRFDTAWRIVRAFDAGAARLSENRAGARTILLDRMGVLAAHYAIADVAFVGGSFTDRGGQNLLEPAVCGCPVLYGPNTANWDAAARALEEAGGGFRCATPDDLSARLVDLLGAPEGRRAAGVAARNAAAPAGDPMGITIATIVELLRSEARA